MLTVRQRHRRSTIVRSVLCDFGLGIFQYGPGKQLINSPLTGYKTRVSCDKASMLHDKNVELLNDVTCRTT